MRWLGIGLMCMAVAGCGKAPDNAPGDTTTSASNVAFAYHYDFRLPSNRIADAQEAHAQACERLGPARCRVTGMTYRVDTSGTASASLAIRVAAPIARGFGRSGVRAIEVAGGALTGAEITGTDAAPDLEAATASVADAQADLADVDRQLAGADLSQSARAALMARRIALVDSRRQAAAAGKATRATVTTTPISFTYVAGTGVGLVARLSEAAQAGYASLTWTLVGALTVLAYLGPPLALLLLLALLWHRVGRRWWVRLFREVDRR